MPSQDRLRFIEEGLSKIDRDLAFLLECFAEVLREVGQPELAAALPWRQHSPDAAESVSPDLLDQAYSVAFQLLNIVEENAAAQTRRARESELGLSAETGLWGHNLARLRDAGFDGAEIARALAQVRVEPVLTAHPTEAKRTTLLEQHRALYLLMLQRENRMWTPMERGQNREEIKQTLERIWRTGELLLTKPDVASERRSHLHYFREVFPAVLRRLDTRLRQAWEDTGLDGAHFAGAGGHPRLRFGSWVGGDRDGHPLVTAEVTRETLEELRLNALLVLHRELQTLAERLTLSIHLAPPPDSVSAMTARLRAQNGAEGEALERRYAEEPWRAAAALMQLALPVERGDNNRLRLASGGNHYSSPAQLEADLAVLDQGLRAIGAARLAQADVLPVRRCLDVFGFHLASLDIRQNSGFHDKAVAQLLKASGVPDGADFASWPEDRRLEFLRRELESPRPLLHAETAAGAEADAVRACHRVLVEHLRRHGSAGLGALIVSMTRSVSDLLSVYLLARETGLVINTTEGLASLLPVVPLFETIDDLEHSPDLLKAFLEEPVTQRSLRLATARPEAVIDLLAQSLRLAEPPTLPAVPDGARPVQQVMVGYSDSNKEGGILAAQWALHRAQAILRATGLSLGVEIRFFHGRGGTISRGAGPTHRFLESLPHGSLHGDFRMTEQGETIAQKYANPSSATYHLELLLAGVTYVTLSQSRSRSKSEPSAALMERMSRSSRAAYHELIATPGFLEFHSQATPIDVLEQSRIGSRPSRRTGQSRSLADLRAIPWVFSWTQSRFYLPGWYGVGSALESLQKEDPAAFAGLREDVRRSPFLSYLFVNVETNLTSASPDIMAAYAALVSDGQVRSRIFGTIESEFNRTRRLLADLFGAESTARRPRFQKTLDLRSDALAALHAKQIALLRTWRAARAAGDTAAADRLLPALLQSINAISSGLRTTG